MPDPSDDKPRGPGAFNPVSWADAYTIIVETTARHIGPSIMTAVMVAGLYLGYDCIQRGSLIEGVRFAFSSYQARADRDTQVRADHLQTEIVAVRDANIIVQDTLKDLLDNESDDAIRSRVFLFHNGTDLNNLAPVMRYDIAYGYAERGRSVGPLESNLPLSNFTQTLPDLVAGRCKIIDIHDLLDEGAKQRMQGMGILESITCPIHDGHGHLLGALGMSWDEPTNLPKSLTINETIRRAQAAADKIGLVYSLMPKSLPHPAGQSKD